jgi:putative transposase
MPSALGFANSLQIRKIGADDRVYAPYAPDANAYAERWVGSVRRECLDRLLIFGRRQLEHVLHVYIRHFNQQRPHRALDLRPPDCASGTDPSPTATICPLQVRRRDFLGGLIHEYKAAA